MYLQATTWGNVPYDMSYEDSDSLHALAVRSVFLSAWRGLGSLAIHKKHPKRPWLLGYPQKSTWRDLGYPQKAPEEALAPWLSTRKAPEEALAIHKKHLKRLWLLSYPPKSTLRGLGSLAVHKKAPEEALSPWLSTKKHPKRPCLLGYPQESIWRGLGYPQKSTRRGLGSLAIHKKHRKRPCLLGYPHKSTWRGLGSLAIHKKAQWRLRSDCLDVLDDLSLYLAYLSQVTVCQIAAHLWALL